MKLSRKTCVLFVVHFVVILQTSHEKSDHRCGKPMGSDFLVKNDRVVGGYDVGYYRYSWYAALMRSGEVNCGGALIGPKTVVTAAHCFKEYLEDEKVELETVYTVRLGVYNVCQSENTVKEYDVKKVHVHDLYKTKKPYFDICLMILDGTTEKYHPICIPSGPIVKRPRDCTVPGLGTLKYEGAMPCTLHEARLLVYPDKECYDMIKNSGNDPSAMKNAFCAGYIQGGIDTCQGDSGGPLQIVNERGEYVLLGVVSFGFNCAEPGVLGVYTDVSKYLPWIKEKSGIQYDSTVPTIRPSKPPPYTRPTKQPFNIIYGRPYRRPIKIIIMTKKQNPIPKRVSASNLRHNTIKRRKN